MSHFSPRRSTKGVRNDFLSTSLGDFADSLSKIFSQGGKEIRLKGNKSVSRRKNTLYIHGAINSYTSYFSPHGICRAIASSEIRIHIHIYRTHALLI